MKRVYIAHPLSAPTREGIEENLARARRWVTWAAKLGVSPCATWIILATEWAETPENRALGLQLDKIEVASCDEVWWVGGRVSEGMADESTVAKRVMDLTTLGAEPPEGDWSMLCERLDGPWAINGRMVRSIQNA